MNRTSVAESEMDERTIEPNDFDSIVFHHQKQVYRTLLVLVRDADAAEALTQECFLRAFKMCNSFRGESSLSTWLVRIAINLAHDHNRNRRWAFWRRLTRTDRIGGIQAVDLRRSPEQAVIDAELLDVIQCAVEKLSERQKTVFLLRFIEDMPLEAIAEAMNLEIGTIKAHLHRATGAVRRACAGRAD
jgi:RNA polymerase sigma-70 factor, ECF subfamily